MKRSSGQFKKLYIFQLGIGLVLLLVLLVLLLIYVQALNGFRPKVETRQFFIGNEINYSDRAIFRNGKDGIVYVKDGDTENSIDTVPLLYMDDPTKLTVTTNMLYMNPGKEAGAKRINAYTTVISEGKDTVFTKERKEALVSGGYLYDGINTYINLEPATLQVGTASFDIGANSYVKVKYRDTIEYYDSLTQEYKLAYLNGLDVLLGMGEKYTIDVGRDVYIDEDGEHLIFSAVEGVKTIPMK